MIHDTRGFTLMELLVAMGLTTVVMVAIFSAYRYQMYAIKGQDIQLELQQAGRDIIDLMTREIRMAGYNPTCAAFSAVVAGATDSFRFQFDKDGDGVISGDEDLTYSLDGTGTILRTGNGTGGTTTALYTGLPSGALKFEYRDANNIGLATPLNASALNAVTSVKVTVQLQKSNPYPVGGGTLKTNLVSILDLRNRYINGGTGCP